MFVFVQDAAESVASLCVEPGDLAWLGERRTAAGAWCGSSASYVRLGHRATAPTIRRILRSNRVPPSAHRDDA